MLPPHPKPQVSINLLARMLVKDLLTGMVHRGQGLTLCPRPALLYFAPPHSPLSPLCASLRAVYFPCRCRSLRPHALHRLAIRPSLFWSMSCAPPDPCRCCGRAVGTMRARTRGAKVLSFWAGAHGQDTHLHASQDVDASAPAPPSRFLPPRASLPPCRCVQSGALPRG